MGIRKVDVTYLGAEYTCMFYVCFMYVLCMYVCFMILPHHYRLALLCVPPGNGFIPTSSLAEILKELDDTLSPEDLENIIKEIDTDGSGTLDFDGTIYCLKFVGAFSIFFLLRCLWLTQKTILRDSISYRIRNINDGINLTKLSIV